MGDKERGILLVYNNKSGSGRSVEPASQAATHLSHKQYPYDLKSFPDLLAIPELLEDSAAVCVYGGDGTVFSIAQMIGKSDRRPALVPIATGTENILANSIHGRKLALNTIPDRVIDTLNPNHNGNPLSIVRLQAGEYTAGDLPAEYMFWLLTAGDSGITRRTLATLEENQERSKIIKNMAVLRTALATPSIDEAVLVTIYDGDGEVLEEFDALEASIVKKVPGKWSRVSVVPDHDKRDQILLIGRGQTNRRSREKSYITLFESLKAMVGAEINEFDSRSNSRQMLTRKALNPRETVVFRPRGNGTFNGFVVDSEIKNSSHFDRIEIKPTVSSPVVEVFSAR